MFSTTTILKTDFFFGHLPKSLRVMVSYFFPLRRAHSSLSPPQLLLAPPGNESRLEYTRQAAYFYRVIIIEAICTTKGVYILAARSFQFVIQTSRNENKQQRGSGNGNIVNKANLRRAEKQTELQICRPIGTYVRGVGVANRDRISVIHIWSTFLGATRNQNNFVLYLAIYKTRRQNLVMSTRSNRRRKRNNPYREKGCMFDVACTFINTVERTLFEAMIM